MPLIDKHRPFHFFETGSFFFITARTYGNIDYLAPDKTKNHFWKLLEEKSQKYILKLKGKVVLNNHYHLLMGTENPTLIPKFIKEIHGASSHFIRQNLPDMVVNEDQVLTSETTPFDKRQDTRLKNEIAKFISPNSARTKVRYSREKGAQTKVCYSRDTRGLKSANPTRHPGLAQFIAPDPRGLAQFIARHKNQFQKTEYRRLKSAITKERITDPKILIALVSKNKPIWYQYLDHAIRTEKDYYKHLNYIHQNPVKHKLTNKMSQYKWSSIHQYIKQKKKGWLIDCFRQYPIIDFQPEGIAD